MQVLDEFQICTAATKALLGNLHGKMTTRTLHSELLYCLSPSKSVSTCSAFRNASSSIKFYVHANLCLKKLLMLFSVSLCVVLHNCMLLYMYTGICIGTLKCDPAILCGHCLSAELMPWHRRPCQSVHPWSVHKICFLRNHEVN